MTISFIILNFCFYRGEDYMGCSNGDCYKILSHGYSKLHYFSNLTLDKKIHNGTTIVLEYSMRTSLVIHIEILHTFISNIVFKFLIKVFIKFNFRFVFSDRSFRYFFSFSDKNFSVPILKR